MINLTTIDLKGGTNSTFRKGQGNHIANSICAKHCQRYAELVEQYIKKLNGNNPIHIDEIFQTIAHLDKQNLITGTEQSLEGTIKSLLSILNTKVFTELKTFVHTFHGAQAIKVIEDLKSGFKKLKDLPDELADELIQLFKVQREFGYKKYSINSYDDNYDLQERADKITKVFQLNFYQLFVLSLVAEEIMRVVAYLRVILATNEYQAFNKLVGKLTFHSLIDNNYYHFGNLADIDHIYRKALHLFTVLPFNEGANISLDNGEFDLYFWTNVFDLDVDKNTFLPLAYWFYINNNQILNSTSEEYTLQYDFVDGNQILETAKILMNDSIYKNKFKDGDWLSSGMQYSLSKLTYNLLDKYSVWLDCNKGTSDHAHKNYSETDFIAVITRKNQQLEQIFGFINASVSSEFYDQYQNFEGKPFNVNNFSSSPINYSVQEESNRTSSKRKEQKRSDSSIKSKIENILSYIMAAMLLLYLQFWFIEKIQEGILR